MSPGADDRVFLILERLEAKLDAYLARIVELETTSKGRDSHEIRLRALEEFKATARVYMGIAGVLGAAAATTALKLFGHL